MKFCTLYHGLFTWPVLQCSCAGAQGWGAHLCRRRVCMGRRGPAACSMTWFLKLNSAFWAQIGTHAGVMGFAAGAPLRRQMRSVLLAGSACFCQPCADPAVGLPVGSASPVTCDRWCAGAQGSGAHPSAGAPTRAGAPGAAGRQRGLRQPRHARRRAAARRAARARRGRGAAGAVRRGPRDAPAGAQGAVPVRMCALQWRWQATPSGALGAGSGCALTLKYVSSLGPGCPSGSAPEGTQGAARKRAASCSILLWRWGGCRCRARVCETGMDTEEDAKDHYT